MICQVGDRRFPAHSYVLASGSESLSKQLRFAELQEEQEQVGVQVEEVHPDISQLVRQFLNTKSCDLFQDGATAASLATLERQEQQDIPKVRGDPEKVSGVSNPSQLLNPDHTDTRPYEYLAIETLEKGTGLGSQDQDGNGDRTTGDHMIAIYSHRF